MSSIKVKQFLRKRKVAYYPPVTLMVRPQPVSPHLISKCPVTAHRGEGADSRQLFVIHEAIETVTVGLSPASVTAAGSHPVTSKPPLA